MKLIEYLDVIKKFIKDYKESAHSDGFVLGVSGGIDSALVLALVCEAVGSDKLYGVILPCESDPSDANDAIELCEKFNVKYEVINLYDTYKQISEDILKVHPLSFLSKANIKVRLRMVTLYAIAQARNSLVIGTDNADEIYVGYFTKYGDGACDLLPIAKLVKSEVFEASKLLGVTENILNKTPSAGLWPDQTDEKELGVTYKELDAYLLGETIDQKSIDRIEHLHRISAHKRSLIATPNEFIRDKK